MKFPKFKHVVTFSSVALFALSGCTAENSENALSLELKESTTNLVDLPEVQIDSDGNRFFPTTTMQERDDHLWYQVLAAFEAEGVEPPPRPVISERKETDWDSYAEEYVNCMHEAGYTSVYIDTEPPGVGDIVGEFPEGQRLSSEIAEYICDATTQPAPVPPPNETQMRALYKHQIESVIPCLDNLGFKLDSFPTEEAFVDGWFATRTYETAISAYGEPVLSMAMDPNFECAEFPPNFWD